MGLTTLNKGGNHMLNDTSYIRKLFYIFSIAASPFIVLLLLTPITKVPVSYNLVCLLISLLYSLFWTDRMQTTVMYIPIQYQTLPKIQVYLIETGFKAHFESSSLLRFEPTLDLPLFAGDISITFDDRLLTVTGQKGYLKPLRKNFVKPTQA
jgi:hypothetical protein